MHTVGWEPYRQSHLTDISKWKLAGYDGDDVGRWLNALQQATSMDSSSGGKGRNIVMDLRVPGTDYFRWVLLVMRGSCGQSLIVVCRPYMAQVSDP